MTTPATLPAVPSLEAAHPRDPHDGFGMLETELGRLPLKALDVKTRITGLVAETVVEQTFECRFEKPIEATYVFPLPDRAAVTAFRMEIGDRIVKGVLKERGEARQVYADAIAKGHRAAITEEERPGVFTMQVGNLMPGDVAKVRLVMVGPVSFEDGEATFRFPLVVAPRYMPGTPLEDDAAGAGTAMDTDAVPDASRISPPVLLPGLKSPVALSLTVDIDPAGLPLSDLRSSLHAVAEDEAEGTRRIRLAPGERLNRDFILRWRLGDDAVRTALSWSRDPDGAGEGLEGAGTFLVTALPPQAKGAVARPRDVVFVLDRSGSMGGWKMVAARRAVGRMLDTLGSRDRFAVLAFDNVVEAVGPAGRGTELIEATDRNRFRTVERLSELEARGGTEMAGPLSEAVDLLSAEATDRDRILVLVTDGQVGNEDQILRTLAGRLADKRVMTLGVDRAVNEGFLKRLAATGGGWCALVESEDRLDEAMDALHRRIGTPVVTGLRVEGEGVVASSLVPGRFPDLFEGAPLRILGRWKGRSPGHVHLRGEDAFGDAWQVELAAPESESETGAIRSEWGRARVRDLEDRYAAGETGLSEEIVRTSLESGVLCRFTAFVAVDEKAVVNEGGETETVVQPVEAPEGWAMFDADAEYGVVAESLASIPSGAPPPAPMASGGMPMRAQVRKEAARSIGGFFGRMRGAPSSADALDEGGGGGDGLSLDAYRRRAADLVRALEGASGEDALRRIAVDLKRLVDDLRSVGAGAEVDALASLLTDVKAALSSPGTADLSALVARATEILETFAAGAGGGPAGPSTEPPKGTRAFWK
jgi:Ca-activated chloride channel homolog